MTCKDKRRISPDNRAAPAMTAWFAQSREQMLQAAACYHRAGEAGNATAIYARGRVYEQGQGFASNRKQAVAHYRRAAERGSGEADAAARRLAGDAA